MRKPLSFDPVAPAELVAKAPETIRARFERLQTLQSAWNTLGRAGLVAGQGPIAEAGARLDDELRAIALSEASGSADDCALDAADAKLDALELGMWKLACDVPIGEFRSALPDAARKDRAAVLALLDLMLIADDARVGFEHQLLSIDFLITLLCTDRSVDPVAIRHDPVNLTPKLRQLCESVEEEDDARREIAEADFYAAAQFDEYDAAALEQQKVSLGAGFFSPRVLRAITTYNASQLQPLEAIGAPAEIEEPEKSEDIDPNLPIFETPALSLLLGALRRRLEGETRGPGPIDQVAWGLDIGFASRSERGLLLAASGTSREDPAAAAMLIGLLCRSLDTLSDDLPAIGISPDVLTSDWLAEVSETIARQVSQQLLGDRYSGACQLQDLRNKYLGAPGGSTRPEPATSASAAPPAPAARAETPSPARRKPRATPKKASPTASAARSKSDAASAFAAFAVRLRKLGPVILAVALLTASASWYTTMASPGRASLSGEQLAQISGHLDAGQRDGEGLGPSFVGTVADSWSGLSSADREAAAIHIVAALQLQGAKNIMIYDSEGRVRIQVLGSGNIHIPAVTPPDGR